MKHVLLFLLLFIATRSSAQMQPGTATQGLIDVSTKSPDVASLGKFGNIPVSYATGVPSISIPVYEITIGNIRLPLALDYHASGIRVSETASSVGLGFALSGIGTISRQTVGPPDEDPNSGLFLSPNPDSVRNCQACYPQYLFDVQKGNADNEPDQFSYSINGQSGKFTFRRDRSIMQTPLTNNKIEFAANNNNFTITDDAGIVYIFGLQMTNTMSLISTQRYYTASWRLTKMVASNSTDTIYFSYETACNPVYQKNENYSYYIGQTVACDANASTSFLNESRYSYQTASLYEAYPKEINWRGGKIVFTNSCDRTYVSGSAMRLNEVNVYANQEGKLKKVKRMVLYQSYFNSTGTTYAFTNATADQKKRLRLDSVGVLPVTGSLPPQVYRMTYNTTVMAPRESEAMDRFGYNNGAFTNTTLIPPQTVLWTGNYYTVGNANRTPDSTFIEACTLTSIQYPLKGKTVFDYEPNAWFNPEMQTQAMSASAYCSAGVKSIDSSVFTVNANDVYFKLSFFLPAFSTSDATDRPRVYIRDLTSGVLFAPYAGPVGDEDKSYSQQDLNPDFVAGHNYSLLVNTYSPTAALTASASIVWTRNLGVSNVRRLASGIRIKSVTNYDDNGALTGKERYEYAGGTMLTDMYYQDINVEQVIPRGGIQTGNGDPCVYRYPSLPPGFAFIFHGNSVVASSECGGSPLLYSLVTKYNVDSANTPLGKTEFRYNIVQDNRAAIDYLTNYGPITYSTRGIYLNNNSWKNNFLADQKTYKSNGAGFQLKSEKVYDYSEYRDTVTRRLKIKNKYISSCCSENNMDSVHASYDFALTLIDQQTGAMLLRAESDTTWDDFGNKIYWKVGYEYNDTTHNYPTLKRSYTSNGEVITDLTKYPHDLAAAGNVYQKMMNRNIVSPVVQQIHQKNGVQLSLSNINYTDWNNNNKLLVPQSVQQQVANYPIETRIRFNKYDLYGNIQEQQKDSDIIQSYVWGYDTAYAIAVVENAALNEIAQTSFEPDAAGYWTIPSAIRDTTQGITGRQSYSLSNGSISKSGITTTKAYIVSYWSRSASATVNGASATSYYNKNGWYYYEHKINAGASSISVSGSATIDELRLYPADAKMISFTYDPLSVMTSRCDVNNVINYFQPDGFMRLNQVMDADKNILKTFEYRIKQ